MIVGGIADQGGVVIFAGKVRDGACRFLPGKLLGVRMRAGQADTALSKMTGATGTIGAVDESIVKSRGGRTGDAKAIKAAGFRSFGDCDAVVSPVLKVRTGE